jgi:hypothetical protein
MTGKTKNPGPSSWYDGWFLKKLAELYPRPSSSGSTPAVPASLSLLRRIEIAIVRWHPRLWSHRGGAELSTAEGSGGWSLAAP